MSDLKVDPSAIAAHQSELTKRWHEEECKVTSTDAFLSLVEENHKHNFTLWHHEDDARREDMGFEFIYKAKRAIDYNNQQRNDFIEKMDKLIFAQVGDNFSDNTQMSTETPGMAIDRLSILALKQFHMKEEVDRTDASTEHKEKCAFKLNVIEKQILDLKTGVQSLLEGCTTGARGFRVYFQFKMYNDPELNPALYNKAKPSQDS